MDNVTILASLTLLLVVGVAAVLVFAGLVAIFLLLKMRGKSAAPEASVSAPPVMAESVEAKTNIPPAPGPDNLAGMFDTQGELTTKTELFQRGKLAIEWEDDEEDEHEATEIFSAHGAAGDLAEFAFEED